MASEFIGLIGPNGGGKGELSKESSPFQKAGFAAISTSGLLSVPPYKEQAQEYINNGDLVPNNIVSAAITAHLDREQISGQRSIILDGVPRIKEQVPILNELADGRDAQAFLLNIHANFNEILERIKNRRAEALAIGEEPRVDDNPAKVQKRYNEFIKNSAGIFVVAGNFGIPIIQIDNTGSLDDFFESQHKALEIIRGGNLTSSSTDKFVEIGPKS